MANKEVEITVDFKKMTPKAVLVTDGTIEEWIPRSQILSKKHIKGKTLELVIPEWLALKKGFI